MVLSGRFRHCRRFRSGGRRVRVLVSKRSRIDEERSLVGLHERMTQVDDFFFCRSPFI